MFQSPFGTEDRLVQAPWDGVESIHRREGDLERTRASFEDLKHGLGEILGRLYDSRTTSIRKKAREKAIELEITTNGKPNILNGKFLEHDKYDPAEGAGGRSTVSLRFQEGGPSIGIVVAYSEVTPSDPLRQKYSFEMKTTLGIGQRRRQGLQEMKKFETLRDAILKKMGPQGRYFGTDNPEIRQLLRLLGANLHQ